MQLGHECHYKEKGWVWGPLHPQVTGTSPVSHVLPAAPHLSDWQGFHSKLQTALGANSNFPSSAPLPFPPCPACPQGWRQGLTARSGRRADNRTYRQPCPCPTRPGGIPECHCGYQPHTTHTWPAAETAGPESTLAALTLSFAGGGRRRIP